MRPEDEATLYRLMQAAADVIAATAKVLAEGFEGEGERRDGVPPNLDNLIDAFGKVDAYQFALFKEGREAERLVKPHHEADLVFYATEKEEAAIKAREAERAAGGPVEVEIEVETR